MMEDEGVVSFNALAMILLISVFNFFESPGKSMPLGELIDPFRVPGVYTGRGVLITTPIR